MYSPGGWLKGFLARVRGEERREKRRRGWGGWQWRRVVLITPYVWTGEGGVEVLFQLINRDTVLLCSVCVSLSFPCLLFPPPSDSPIRDNVSGIDTARSGYYDRNTVLALWGQVPCQNSVVNKTAWLIDLLFNQVDCGHCCWLFTARFTTESVQLISI